VTVIAWLLSLDLGLCGHYRVIVTIISEARLRGSDYVVVTIRTTGGLRGSDCVVVTRGGSGFVVRGA
jgi:hypothetical protein